MSAPRLTIVVPCYNHGATLAEAVDSALAQTLTDLEVIVVDDGSTDPATRAVLESFRRERTTVIHQPNRGCAAARNTGIRAGSGQFILPLDADDRLLPEYAARAVDVLESRADVGLVYCRARFFDARNGEWNLPDFELTRMLRSNQIFNAGVYRRSDWERVGGYCEELRLREDYDFWLGLLELGVGVLRLDEVLFEYRKHADPRHSKSKRARRLQEADAYHRIRSRHAGLYARHPQVLLDWLHELECRRLQELDNRLGSRLGRWLRALGGRP